MGSILSDQSPPTPGRGAPYPISGTPITILLETDDDDRTHTICEHEGYVVTSDWTGAHLNRVVEKMLHVHSKCQLLLHANKELQPDCTIRALCLPKKASSDSLPKKIHISLLINRSMFPECLPTFNMVQVPLDPEDFKIPAWRDYLKRRGFYFQLEAKCLEKVGLRKSHKPSDSMITGNVTPIRRITLTEESRVAACIPPEAQDFAWSYPVGGWEEIDGDAYSSEDWNVPNSSKIVKSFLSVGGFIYFDEHHQIAAVTTPGPSQDSGGISFDAPQLWPAEATIALVEAGRFQVTTIKPFFDAGARYVCYLWPGEKLMSVSGELLPDDKQPDVPHGGFAYLFHEDLVDTSASSYALDRYFPITQNDTTRALNEALNEDAKRASLCAKSMLAKADKFEPFATTSDTEVQDAYEMLAQSSTFIMAAPRAG